MCPWQSWQRDKHKGLRKKEKPMRKSNEEKKRTRTIGKSITVVEIEANQACYDTSIFTLMGLRSSVGNGTGTRQRGSPILRVFVFRFPSAVFLFGN